MNILLSKIPVLALLGAMVPVGNAAPSPPVPKKNAALSKPSKPSFVFGIGGTIPNLGMGLTTFASGQSVPFTESYVGLVVGGQLPIFSQRGSFVEMGVEPRYFVSLNRLTDNDNSVSKQLHQFDLRIYSRLTQSGLSWLEFFLGPSLTLKRLTGSGGTTTLNNGNTKTTFALASGSSTASYWGAHLGMSICFPYSLRMEFFGTSNNISNSTSRNYSVGTAITYAYY